MDRARLRRGLEYLRTRGHEPIVAPHVLGRHGYLAGSDEDRAGDLNDVISVDDSPAILFARGGYGLTRILDRIDLDGLRRRPRLLLGFSDMTALFMALQRPGPYVVHYGPNVSELGEPGAFDEATLWNTLYGRGDAIRIPFRSRDVLKPGRGRGRLIGGCLSLLVSLLGTRHDPDYDGAILFWEDIGEEPYRIDRMLTHLRNAGKLDRLRGMVIGSLTGCRPLRGRPSLTLPQVLHEVAGWGAYPIVWNLRAGHIRGKLTLPLGASASLNTARGTLTIRVPSGPRSARTAI